MSKKVNSEPLVLTQEKKKFVSEIVRSFDSCCVWPDQYETLNHIKGRIIQKIGSDYFGPEASLGEDFFMQEGSYHTVWVPVDPRFRVLKVSKIFIKVLASTLLLNRVYIQAREQFKKDPSRLGSLLSTFCKVLQPGWMGASFRRYGLETMQNFPSEKGKTVLSKFFQNLCIVAYTKLSKSNANKIREQRIQKSIWGCDAQSSQLQVDTQKLCGTNALALSQSRLREDQYIPDSEVMHAVVDIYIKQGRVVSDPHRINWCRDTQGKLRLIDCEGAYYALEDEGDSDDSLSFRDSITRNKEFQSRYRRYLCQPDKASLIKTMRVVRFLIGVISCPDLKGATFAKSYLEAKATDGSLCNCFKTPAFRKDDADFYLISPQSIEQLKRSALQTGRNQKRTPNLFEDAPKRIKVETDTLPKESSP